MKLIYRFVAWLGRKKGERLARKREAEIDARLREIERLEGKVKAEWELEYLKKKESEEEVMYKFMYNKNGGTIEITGSTNRICKSFYMLGQKVIPKIDPMNKHKSYVNVSDVLQSLNKQYHSFMMKGWIKKGTDFDIDITKKAFQIDGNNVKIVIIDKRRPTRFYDGFISNAGWRSIDYRY